MHRFVILLSCAAGAALTIAACGGIGDDNLFGSGGGGNGGAGATGSTSSGPAATSSSTSSGAGNAGGAGGMEGVSSTSTTSTTSTTTSSSSSSGMPPATLLCGAEAQTEQTCDPGQICCFDTTGNGDACGSPGQCGAGFIEIPCMGPSNCPGGQVCCASVDFDTNMDPYMSVSCQASCNDPNNEVVLCSNGGQADPDACPQGYTCDQSEWLDSGYDVCNPPAMMMGP